MFIKEYLIHCTKILINEYDDIISIRPGHNGPYNDQETNVRNIAHFICLLAYTFNATKENDVKVKLDECVKYLMETTYWINDIYISRLSNSKDETNGVIGHAWVLEALISYYKLTKDKNILQRIKKVIDNQPFNYDFSVWEVVDSKGNNLGIDTTFNHQLWYAAVISELNISEYNRQVELFIDNVLVKVQTYSDGVVFHNSPLQRISSFKGLLRNCKNRFLNYNKSVGYHSFNLYAMAILYQNFPKHSFWSSIKFKKLFKSVTDKKFVNELNSSIYSWPYNPPGFEFGVAYDILPFDDNDALSWIELQFKRTFDENGFIFCNKQAVDNNTSKFRIYELTRMKSNFELSLINTTIGKNNNSDG